MYKKTVVVLIAMCLICSCLYATGAKETEPEPVSEEVRAEQIVVETVGNLADTLTNTFRSAFLLGHYNLKQFVINPLIIALLTLEILILGLLLIVQHKQVMSGPEMLWRFFFTILTIALIQLLPLMVDMIMSVFSKAGFAAGGARTSSEMQMQPSIVMGFYNTTVAPLEATTAGMRQAMDYLTNGSFKIGQASLWFEYGATMLIIMLIKLVVLVMFLFTLLNVMMWIIELYFLMAIATFLLPWQLLQPTKFLASGTWQALFGQGIKLFCLTFTITCCEVVFKNIIASNPINWYEIVSKSSFGSAWTVIPYVLFAAMIFCYFVLKGPAVAKALILGQPTMETMGTHFILSSGAKAMGTATVASGIIGSGALGAAGRVGAAVGTGLTYPLRNVGAGVASGINAVGQGLGAAAQSVGQGVSNLASSIADRVRNS